ncbi:MAG: hypothetical protein Alpg2KO_06730 [Alphaproteobacteria bacterium]
MSKLQKLGAEWVAAGLFSSMEEIEDAAAHLMEQHLQHQLAQADLPRLSAQDVEGIDRAISELDDGKGNSYATSDDAHLAILGKPAVRSTK